VKATVERLGEKEATEMATVFLRFLVPHQYSIPQTGRVQRCPRSWYFGGIHATLHVLAFSLGEDSRSEGVRRKYE
jgi:hypothetical protein